MKKTEEINQIIVELYDLILNKEVKERERVSLIEAKNKLEKQEIFSKSNERSGISTTPFSDQESIDTTNSRSFLFKNFYDRAI